MTSPADIATYNQRRRVLAELGIYIHDQYDQDDLNDDTDPTGGLRHWRRLA